MVNLTGSKADQVLNEIETTSPFDGVNVVDSAPGLTQTLGVVLFPAANGTFSNLDGGTYDAATGIYTVTGTTSQVTEAIDGLVFTPTAQQGAAGQTVITEFAIGDTDSDGAVAADITTSVIVTGTTANFTIFDSNTGQTTTNQGQPYSGPVTGLANAFILPTTDQVTVTVGIANVFIQIGVEGQSNPAIAGIDVSKANGNNVLDSYANSSFLTDGIGTDQNYLDARALTQNAWDTVVNFHSGDNVTLWGVTQADFNLDWIGDTEGATGFTGLTGVFVPATPGQPDAGVTLAGYKIADLTNDKLTVSYNTINGTPYASIHAN